MLRLILEPRAAPLRGMRLASPLIALACTVLISIPVLLALGLPPAVTLRNFFIEPLRTANGVSEWLLTASPLVLIALGESVAFRANVWNIGAEGMFTAGAIAAAWCALHFGASAPHAALLLAMACAGALGGMAWASIPAFLKTRANTNEILVTLMLNYVAGLALRYLVNGPASTIRRRPRSSPLPCSSRSCRDCASMARFSSPWAPRRRPGCSSNTASWDFK